MKIPKVYAFWRKAITLTGMICVLIAPCVSVADAQEKPKVDFDALDIEEACQYHAAVAAGHQQQNISFHCGFTGPEWCRNSHAYFIWCLTQNNSRKVRAIQEQREQLLESCKPDVNIDEVCQSYAEQAVASQQVNVSYECGFTGDEWSDDRAAHVSWCMAGRKAQVAALAQEQREARLNPCQIEMDAAREAREDENWQEVKRKLKIENSVRLPIPEKMQRKIHKRRGGNFPE